MVVGITLFIVAALVITIWVVIEFQRMKHKLYAFFLIGLVLFLYVSITFTLKDRDIDFTSVQGFVDAGKLYFSWLFSVGKNFGSITTNAIKMDWGANESIVYDAPLK